MSEMQNENEQSFAEMLEASLISIHKGEIIEGTIIGVNADEIYVNIGYKSDGIIPKSEFSNYPTVNLSDLVTVGNKIRAKVLRVNDGEGQVLLTYKRLKAEDGMKRVEELYNSGEEVTAKVSLVLAGGLVVIIDEVRVFIPASLVSDSYVSDLSEFKDQELTFIISEFNTKKGRIIGNRRILLEKEKSSMQVEIFKNLEVGAVLEGTVKNITDYGVFVNLDGVDGLVHISELSWGRVKSPKEVVKINEKVRVRVISINQEKKKISLSMKFDAENPWNDAANKYAVGNVVSGRVARMTDFGAFIELEEGVDALLHVSQISIKHVEKPSDALTVNQVIEAKVTDLNLDEKKISLSIKGLELEREESNKEETVEVEDSKEAAEATVDAAEEVEVKADEAVEVKTETTEEA
ncbi:30S ribosomal protein S1 [Petrocella atlantisensis]|uniref:30S ribosomal protein S1 n=1 Tax=Petrocella atlantisensis TaxID=2173034 RepID=A0A3P7PSC5_9FIRM|nr:30S ribosomal protein S1 [Petrocella atlantisensis]VDN46121.1 30S ribosomal protein S1 [Petrocella atlantisensis]